ncbi:hypothetical protein D3C85_461880 [compost metagenome]
MAEHQYGIVHVVLPLLEPGAQARGGLRGPLLALEVESAIEVAEAHPGEGVDDVAVALYPLQVLVPAIGLVAIHVVQQPAVLIAAQQRLHFTGTTPCRVGIPGRRESGMDHHDGQIRVLRQQGTVAQPLQQLVPIRGLHQGLQLVFLLEGGDPMSHRQQVQVVVAEHGHGAASQ